jgi:membrane peptidoglycan carboxypeptidase
VYFGKPLTQITDPSEAAFLASLIQSPTQYSNAFTSDASVTPANKALDLKALTNRWTYVINGLVTMKWITPAQGSAAKFPTPIAQGTQTGLSGINGYMYQAANEWLTYEHNNGDSSAPTSDQIQKGGYTVVTTFDPTLMQDAVTAVNNELWNNPALSTSHSGLVASMSSVDPSTGDVKAFYSGNDYSTSQFLTFYDGAEQPGSSMKAFTLATAIANGLAPTSKVSGATPYVPTTSTGQQFKDAATGQSYTVHNDNNDNYGMVDLNTATAQSINTAFVRLEMQVGMDKVYSMLQNVGLVRNPSVDTMYPGMTLGIWSESPLHMSEAYATIANGGTYHSPVLVTKVLYDGKVVWQPKTSTTVAMSPNVAAGVTQTLQNVVKSGTGVQAATVSGLSNIVGKTGTTDQNQAGWFNGYTPKLATSVGLWRTAANGNLLTLQGLNRDGSPVYGGQYPTEIWGDYMKLANGYVNSLTSPLPAFNLTGLTGTIAPTTTPPSPTVTTTAPPTASTTTQRSTTTAPTTTSGGGTSGTSSTCGLLNWNCTTGNTTGSTTTTTAPGGTGTTTRKNGGG